MGLVDKDPEINSPQWPGHPHYHEEMSLYVVEGFQRPQYGGEQKDLWVGETRVRFELYQWPQGFCQMLCSGVLASGGPAGVRFEPAVS